MVIYQRESASLSLVLFDYLARSARKKFKNDISEILKKEATNIGDIIIKGLSDNRKQLTYLPQHNFLPNHIKVRRIIDIFCTKSNAALIAKHNLIEPMLENKYRELAGGEKRILEIFLIVFSDSKYCLIDEPFNGIAPIHKEDIKNIIKEQSIFKGFILTDRDYRSIWL